MIAGCGTGRSAEEDDAVRCSAALTNSRLRAWPRVLPPGPSCPPRTPSCRSGACPAAAPGMQGTPDLPSPASSLYGPGPEPPRPPTRCQFSPRSSPSPSRPPCCALLLSATITGKRECCASPRKPALSLQLPYPCQVLAKIT